MIRCVAFDFDGTLVDSNTLKRQMFDDVVRNIEGGVALMAQVLRRTPGDRYDVFARFVEMSPSTVHESDERKRDVASALACEYTRRCEDAIAMCRELPGATALLHRLQQARFTVALNSATPRDALVTIVQRRGWSGSFAHILGAPTPKAENLRTLVASTRIERTEMVMVGDRDEDRVAAATVGCHFVALTQADGQFDVPPRHAIAHLAELPALLLTL